MAYSHRRILVAAALATTALAAAGPADALAAKPHPDLTVGPNPALIGPLPGPTRLGGVVVSFDASASSDPDGGSIAKYEFDLDGDGTYERDNGSDPTTSRRYSTAGSYTIHLRVTDDDGETQFLTYSVLAVHRRPVARLGAPASAVIGRAVTLDASASTDDNRVDRYQWDLDGDGSFETDGGGTPTVTHAFSGPTGPKTVRLRVTDRFGATGETSATVFAHRAPTTTFVVAPRSPFAGEPVSFAAAATDDEGIAKYEWDLDGNGSFETDTGTDPTALRTYPTATTVEVGLRVTDTRGVSALATRRLTIAPRPAQQGGQSGQGRDTTGPLVLISRSKLRASRKGLVAIKLTCPANEIGGCSGRLNLAASKGGKRYGATTFRLTRGQAATVTVKLKGAARKALRKKGKLAARATVVATDVAGNAGTSTATLKLKRAKR